MDKINLEGNESALYEGNENGEMILKLIEKVNEIVDWINAQ